MISVQGNTQRLNQKQAKGEGAGGKLNASSTKGTFTQATSQTQQLFNSMEELSVGISTTKRQKKEVRLKKNALLNDKESMKKYFKNSVFLNKDGFFKNLLQTMVTKKFITRDQMLNFLQDNIPNVGDQFLFLEEARNNILDKITTLDGESAQAKNLSKLVHVMEKTVNQILDMAPEKITASLNVSNKVYEFVDIEPNNNPQKMIEFYLRSVIGFKSLSDTLKYIQDNFNKDTIFRSIDFLLESVASDLRSPRVSLQEAKLKTIHDDIYQLRVLKDVYRTFSKTLSYIRGLDTND